MGGIFYSASAFNQDIGDWVVDSVTDMGAMFYGASLFDQDIGDWAVHSVTSMFEMFAYASSFNQDLSSWAVDNLRETKMHNNRASVDAHGFSKAKADTSWQSLPEDRVLGELPLASCRRRRLSVARGPARKYPRRDDWLLWLLRAFFLAP